MATNRDKFNTMKNEELMTKLSCRCCINYGTCDYKQDCCAATQKWLEGMRGEINKMQNHELACFLVGTALSDPCEYCNYEYGNKDCNNYTYGDEHCGKDNSCVRGIVEWLESEAKE